jgi:glycosyltransferase involved in cell wall biosynthesis
MKHTKLQGTLVILTLNEIEGLNRIFSLIPIQEIDQVFAVDGGSSDGTLIFFKEHGIAVFSQGKRGRSEAFRVGVRNAKHEDIIFFSPDGNENPKDIIKMFGHLKEGNDMVIASRFMKGSRCDEDHKLIKHRKFGNKVFTLMANTLFGGKLSDSINGFRGIKKSAFLKLNPDGDGFDIEFQLSIRAMKRKMRILEFPTVEKERIGGRSTARSFKVGKRFIGLILNELRS